MAKLTKAAIKRLIADNSDNWVEVEKTDHMQLWKLEACGLTFYRLDTKIVTNRWEIGYKDSEPDIGFRPVLYYQTFEGHLDLCVRPSTMVEEIYRAAHAEEQVTG